MMAFAPVVINLQIAFSITGLVGIIAYILFAIRADFV